MADLKVRGYNKQAFTAERAEFAESSLCLISVLCSFGGDCVSAALTLAEVVSR
jgi:hypothetical protein